MGLQDLAALGDIDRPRFDRPHEIGDQRRVLQRLVLRSRRRQVRVRVGAALGFDPQVDGRLSFDAEIGAGDNLDAVR